MTWDLFYSIFDFTTIGKLNMIRADVSSERYLFVNKPVMAESKAKISKFEGDIPIAIDIEGNDDDVKLKSGFHPEAPSFVFCIDGRYRMLDKDGLENSPLLMSMKCVRHIVRSYITSSAKCTCAILLTGCDRSDNDMNMINVSRIKPMSYLDADTMKSIDDFIKCLEEDNYKNNYGFGAFSLSNTLWAAATILTRQKTKVKKRILLFTNDDNPTAGDRQERTRTFSKVADLEKLRINIDVLNIGPNFDVNKFYKEILQFSGKQEVPDEPLKTLSQMIAHFETPHSRHVSLVSLPLYLSSDFFITVSVHSLVRKVKIPAKRKLCAATNDIVASKMHNYNEETGEDIKREDVLSYETVADKNIYFTADEKKILKDVGERRLRLLGFKPKSELQFELYVKPGAFLYPSDAVTRGGSAIFQALLERCLNKDVVAICTYCPRPTSSVRFVALMPQAEVSGEGRSKYAPPGFHVIFLPFGDEVRDWDEDCQGKAHANQEQVDIVKEVIGKLTIPYTPGAFPNPQLANHWAVVEAIALDLEDKEDIADVTVPDHDYMNDILLDLPQRFQDEIYSEGYSTRTAQTKGTREKPDILHIDFAAIEEIAREGKLKTQKIDILKNYLKHEGLGYGLSKMKKDDVIEKINQHLSIQQ